jgi:hypothetical protein
MEQSGHPDRLLERLRSKDPTLTKLTFSQDTPPLPVFLDALEEYATIQHVELPTWITDRHHYFEEYDRLAATIRRLAPQSLRIYHHSGGCLHCKVLSTLLARGLVQLTTTRAVSILNREDVQVLADMGAWTCPDLVTIELQHLRIRTHDERPLLDPLLVGLTQYPNLEHAVVSVSP